MNVEVNTAALPKKASLLTTTAVALVAAIVILVVVVLPAEYGVDWTRLGGVLGLTAMGEAKSMPSSGDVPVMHAHTDKFHSGHVEIAMKGNEQLEYKATLALGEPMLYTWSVTGGAVYFEFHGEPTEGKWPEKYYRSYQIGEKSEGERGSFVAPFTGLHGWYWRNLSDRPITIVLDVSGYYTRLGRIE